MTVRRFASCLAAGWMAFRAVVLARSEETPGEGMARMKTLVRTRFPGVRQLSTAALDQWIKDRSRPTPLLVDVRTADEFAVSHLPGARRLDPDASEIPRAWGTSKASPIVFYCSVGYRSSQMAERLSGRGWTNVFNLEGSIFEWANEGRPVEAGGRSVRVVHPYNATFGKLLRPEYRPTASTNAPNNR